MRGRILRTEDCPFRRRVRRSVCSTALSDGRLYIDNSPSAEYQWAKESPFCFRALIPYARPKHHIFNEPLHIDYRRLKQRLFKRHCVISVERKICADTARIETDPLPICECVVGYSPEIGCAVPDITSLRVSALAVLGQVKTQRLIPLCFGYCGEAFGIFLAAHLAVDMDIDSI